jgi:hypothetical protein
MWSDFASGAPVDQQISTRKIDRQRPPSPSPSPPPPAPPGAEPVDPNAGLRRLDGTEGPTQRFQWMDDFEDEEDEED